MTSQDNYSGVKLPYRLTVDGLDLECHTLLRHLPERRIVCAGTWNGQEVVAKIYLPHRRARFHAWREERGVRAMLERGIVTPRLLYAGRTATGFVLLFERIPNAQSAREVWATADMALRGRLLEQMVQAVAAQHEAGLVQHDLHLGNFLCAEGRVYCIDGDGIRTARWLGRRRALGNLALLLAQLQPENDALFDGAYRCYIEARGWESSDARQKAFLERVRTRRTACIDAHVASKVFRECTAFVAQKSARRFTVIDRRYDSPALRELLDDLDRHVDAGKPLKRGRTSTVSLIAANGLPLVAKRYNIKSFWHGMLRAFQPTRAAISWRNGHRLVLYGIPTPQPVALVEKRFGPLRNVSYVLTEYVEGENAYAFFDRCTPEEASSVVEKIVRILKQLRSLRLGHGDLKATNLLVGTDAVYLTDLDAMRQYRTERSAESAHQADLDRFMQNWNDKPAVDALFRRLLN